MVNLVALVLIVMSATPKQPTPVKELPPPAGQVQSAPATTTRQLTPEQKAWFAHAIDHILEGK